MVGAEPLLKERPRGRSGLERSSPVRCEPVQQPARRCFRIIGSLLSLPTSAGQSIKTSAARTAAAPVGLKVFIVAGRFRTDGIAKQIIPEPHLK